jgi:hypothetical protein
MWGWPVSIFKTNELLCGTDGLRHKPALRSYLKFSIRLGASVLLCAALLVSSPPAPADFVPQGPKLVGTGAVGNADQGSTRAEF